MSRLTSILVLAALSFTCIDACANQDQHTTRAKHPLHAKMSAAKNKVNFVKQEKATPPIRNQEWYLSQIRSSDQFKAVALGRDRTEFLPKEMVSDHLVKQATVSNIPIVINNKENDALIKSASASANSDKITFMFVPPFINNKLMDMQKRSDMHSVVTLSWKQ